MDLLQKIVAHAKSNKQRIVLPEATEERTLKAADRVLADDIADIILIGNPGEISRLAQQWGLSNIQKATIIDPENNPKSEMYAEKLAEIRKSKGMTIEEARKLVRNPLYLGCMIIKLEEADGQVSGALSTTGETLRPALQIIKCAPGVTCVSGAMLVITHEHRYGEDGIFVMGDVAVTPVPTAEQLAQIAVCTAQTARTIAGITDPRVAMLSFSTKGSAKHENVDKVVEATRLAHELDPELHLDGELQADAALVGLLRSWADLRLGVILIPVCQPVPEGHLRPHFFGLQPAAFLLELLELLDAFLLRFSENIFRLGIAVIVIADDDAALPPAVLALPYRSVSGFSLSCHGFNSFPKMSSMKPPTMPQAVFCISDVTWV